jgi:uncharacterized protein
VDEAKNWRNIRKHGIDFADAVDVFNHPMLTLLDEQEEYGEDRWLSIGWIQLLMGVVIHSERDADVIRIISARKATRREIRRYEQSFKN